MKLSHELYMHVHIVFAENVFSIVFAEYVFSTELLIYIL